MAEHTILFTITARAVALNTDSLPISVFVSPRLTGDQVLGRFPDWVAWTANLKDHGLDLRIATGARTATASIDTSVLRPDLWAELFNRETPVEPFVFDDYSERAALTYSVNDCLSVLKAVYQDASVSLALPDPAPTGDPEEDDRGSQSPNRGHLRDLVAGLQVNWDGGLAPRLRTALRLHGGDAARGEVGDRRPRDSEGLAVFDVRPTAGDLRRAALPFAVFHHMPSPPEHDQLTVDPSTIFDFHKALSALNSYPRLLRALGLVGCP